MADLGHGRGWLAAAPAASILRIDAQHDGAIPINDAGRTRAQQQALWDLYWSKDRPGWLFEPARPGESPHEAGNAVDLPNPGEMLAVMEANGWRRPLPNTDPVHFVYWPNLDQHIDDLINPTITQKESSTMFIAVVNGNWHLVIPQGNAKPRAVILGGESGAPESGVPRFYFTDPIAVQGIETAVEGIHA